MYSRGELNFKTQYNNKVWIIEIQKKLFVLKTTLHDYNVRFKIKHLVFFLRIVSSPALSELLFYLLCFYGHYQLFLATLRIWRKHQRYYYDFKTKKNWRDLPNQKINENLYWIFAKFPMFHFFFFFVKYTYFNLYIFTKKNNIWTKSQFRGNHYYPTTSLSITNTLLQ